MHKRTFWLMAALVLATLALAATGSARVSGPDNSAAKDAGTLVFGAEQGGGPDWCLNLILDIDCSAFWNVIFETPVLRGAFLYTPSLKYRPDLISRYKLQTRPMRVTYYIRKNAHWSDGVPVTGKDWKFTWQTAVNKKYEDHIDPLGWEDIKSVTGNGKVVKVTFKRNFAPWRGLFSYILPRHALAGEDMLTAWNDCICNPKKNNQPIGNGPFLMTRFDRGSGVTLTRNNRGWHGKKAKLSSIVFRFITNTNSEIQAIRSGEVDAIYPQPQLALADLRSQAGLKVVSHLSLSWEHIEIQQGPKGNPLAKQTWLRQALITALNRDAAAGEGAVRDAEPERQGAEQPHAAHERADVQRPPLQQVELQPRQGRDADAVAWLLQGRRRHLPLQRDKGLVQSRVHVRKRSADARVHDLPGSGGESRSRAPERVRAGRDAVRQPPSRARLRPGDVHVRRHRGSSLRRRELHLRRRRELLRVLQPHRPSVAGAVGPRVEREEAAGAREPGRRDHGERGRHDPALPAADVLRLQDLDRRHGRQPDEPGPELECGGLVEALTALQSLAHPRGRGSRPCRILLGC
jgi:hypothetical protein